MDYGFQYFKALDEVNFISNFIIGPIFMKRIKLLTYFVIECKV